MILSVMLQGYSEGRHLLLNIDSDEIEALLKFQLHEETVTSVIEAFEILTHSLQRVVPESYIAAEAHWLNPYQTAVLTVLVQAGRPTVPT